MKQFSFALNLILLVAVGVLYYLHFTGIRKNKTAHAPGSEAGKSAERCSSYKGPVIAYVDIDSLNANVTYIKKKNDELQAEGKRIESSVDSRYRSLEAERDAFLKKGNTVTQQEVQEMEQHLMQGQQQIEAQKQQQQQQLAQKGAKISEDIQAKVKDFINEYNADKKYTFIIETGAQMNSFLYKDSTLDITAEIVNGLNEKMKETTSK